MSSGGTLIFVAVIGLLIWFVVKPKNPTVPPDLLNPNVDINELQKAEQEVQDLDADVSPDRVDEHLPDWGPGAPKP
jgi:hypothetical protein